jgi:hypothetical protein
MIKKDSKQRLFEVMGHLDKTFKPKLNEDTERNNDFARQYNTDNGFLAWYDRDGFYHAVDARKIGYEEAMKQNGIYDGLGGYTQNSEIGVRQQRLGQWSSESKLYEGFEATDSIEAPIGGGEESQEPQEKTPEEKLQELTAKVDELYALLHGEEEGEEEESAENLQEWNFDKKKGEKKEEKGEEKKDGKKKWNFEKEEGKESLEHEEGESHEEEEKEHKEKKELDEAKPKIPVAAIAKVGK